MKLKKGSTNNLGAFKSNSSPKRNVTNSFVGKRKLGKNEIGWFNAKRLFFGLGIYIAFVAWMFSHYWIANLNIDSSQNEVITWIDGFTPPCPIKSKETISAINRATSDSCKQRIAELACRSVYVPGGIGNLYATHLPNLCPIENFVKEDIREPGLLWWTPEWAPKLSDVPFMKMGKSAPCPAGTEITTEDECREALKWTKKLWITPLNRTSLVTGFWRHVPYQCSYQYNGDKAFHFNYQKSNNPQSLLGGSYRMICKKEKVQKSNQVRIAFLLTINGRASRQLRRLIKQLYNGQSYFYIHVDSRQDYLYREMKALELKFPENIYVTPNRSTTIWGGTSYLSMLIGCFEDLLQKPWEWDFVLNLSETDYPLKKREDFVEFLTSNRDKNFVLERGLENPQRHSTWIKNMALDQTFFECDKHMWRLGPRKLPLGIQIRGGSNWILLNKEFVSYVVNGDDELINGLRTLYSYTLVPAESFFHTTLRNSKFCLSLHKNNLRVENWKKQLGCKSRYASVMDWKICSPNGFTPEDTKLLKESRSKQIFFGRKFQPDIAQSMLDEADLLISADNRDEKMEYHTPANWEHPSRTRYWQSVYHHLDTSPQPDEATVNVAKTLCAVAMDVFLKNFSRQYHFDKLHEITSYHNENALEGVLLKFSIYGNTTKNFEVFVNHYMDVIPPRNPKGIPFRHGEFQVGVNFDSIELIFRNYLNAMNEHSTPVLLYSFTDAKVHDEKDFVMKVAWIDPNGNIAYITKKSIENSYVRKQTIVPEFKTPMINGIWTVMVINQENNELVVKIPFLVVPSDENYVDYKTVSYKVDKEERQIMTKMFQESNKNEEDKKWLKLNHGRVDSNNVNSVNKENKTAWKKQLVNEFYTLESICYSDHADAEGKLEKHARILTLDIPSCKETVWSSLSPDPKSDISKFDNEFLKLV